MLCLKKIILLLFKSQVKKWDVEKIIFSESFFIYLTPQFQPRMNKWFIFSIARPSLKLCVIYWQIFLKGNMWDFLPFRIIMLTMPSAVPRKLIFFKRKIIMQVSRPLGYSLNTKSYHLKVFVVGNENYAIKLKVKRTGIYNESI